MTNNDLDHTRVSHTGESDSMSAIDKNDGGGGRGGEFESPFNSSTIRSVATSPLGKPVQSLYSTTQLMHENGQGMLEDSDGSTIINNNCMHATNSQSPGSPV